MKRSKKFVLVTILAAVVLIGGIGGSIALADEGDDVVGQPAAWCGGPQMDRACELYGIRWGGWQKRGEVDPEAMKARLQELLDQGKINQEQFDAIQDRIEAMPDGMPAFGFRGHGGMRGFRGTCAQPGG